MQRSDMLDRRTYRCPLCDRAFLSDQARAIHLLNTTKHPTIVDEFLRVQFLLAEAERTVSIYRDKLRGQQEWDEEK